MDFLANPNIIYLLLAAGLMIAILALVAPGTGILEIGAIFLLGVAGWAIYANNVPINYWALGVLLVGAILFYLSVRRSRGWSLLIASIIAIVFGSAYLFAGEVWYLPAVDPILASVVSVVSGCFFWVAARKTIEANKVRPTHDLEALIGAIGEAKTNIQSEGSAFVAGELWSARSEIPILEGQRVRVVSREGFILNVEPVE